MLNHAILFENVIEHRQRTAAIDHVVFGDNLEPIHHRFLFENVPVVRNPQADSYSVFGKSIETIRWHKTSGPSC